MKYFLLLMFVIPTIYVQAQTNADFRDWVTSLAIDSSGVVYAGTYSNGNGIFLSTNGGSVWQHTKMRYGVTSMTITKKGSLVAFAYGYLFSRYLFRLTNLGSQLDSVSLNFSPSCITSSSDGSLYAASYGQGLYKSTDEGTTWTMINTSLSPTIIPTAITVNPSGAIIVATTSGVYRSINYGQSWQRGDFGMHDSITIEHVMHSVDGKIYAGAFESMGINAHEIYISSDTGRTWSLSRKVNFSLDMMSIDSTGTLYAGNSNGVYRIKENGDTTYLGLGGIAVKGWGVRSLIAYTNNTIFAGAWGGVYKTIDTGSTWQLLHNGMISDSLSGNFSNPLPFGSYISCGVVDAYGNCIVGTDSAGIFRSVDQGKTWQQTALTGVGISSIIFDSLGNLFASTQQSIVYTSNDGGLSWTDTEYPYLVTGNRFYVLNANIARFPWGGWDSTRMILEYMVKAGCSNGIYTYYENASPIWSPEGVVNTPVTAITTLASGDVAASTIGGSVYISPGGWNPWILVGNINMSVKSLVTNQSQSIFAVGSRGVFRSTDNGKNWEQKISGMYDTNLVSAAIDKAGNIYVGSFQIGDIYKSTDQANSWTTYATLTFPVRCIFIDIKGEHFYASVEGRLFNSFLTTTSVGETPNSQPYTLSLSQNYPNPFNPATTISFFLPSRSVISLKIFDILGREIATIVNSETMSAGNHSRRWNAAGVSSGLYFYRLQAGAFTETKKLLLLR